jgi:flagellar M-ring protein FliF
VPKVDVRALRGRFGSAFDGFTRGQKTMLGLAVVAVLVGGLMFTKWSSAPSYTALYSNLSAKDAGEITTSLTSKGVSYQLADNGSTILVPRSDVYQLRLDLSSQGLPATGRPGYALLDEQGITTSEFRQRVDYQRALEGELSNTISAIEGLAGATVHLVIPKDDLFSNDASKPTASVLVQQTQGERLPAGQVQAIVHLVASSVEGLAPGDVTVADGQGRVLSAAGGAGGAAAGDLQSEQQLGFERQLASSIEDLLVPVVGQGGAVVKVRAQLDFDKRATTSETFGTKTPPIVVAESTTNEAYEGADSPAQAGGVLGPDGGPTATTDGGTYDKDTADRTFAVDKVTEQVETAPGTVERLSVAVLLDAGVGNVDQRAVEDLVVAAAGIDANRGDTVEVNAMRFDDSAAQAAEEALKEEAAAAKQGQLMDMVRTLGSVLIVALVLFFAWRSARRATPKREPIELPPLAAIDLQAPGEIIDAVEVDGEGNAIEPPAPLELDPVAAFMPQVKDPIPAGLVDMIDNQPDDVAQMLRTWLTDRK